MKNIFKFFYPFIFVCFIFLLGISSQGAVFAQNKNIDSILTLLKKDKPDTNRVNHLCQITREYQLSGDFEKGISYGNEALALADKLDFKRGIANASNNIGKIYLAKNNYSKSLEHFIRALKLEEELKNKEGIFTSLDNIGNTCTQQNDYPKAMEYYFKELKMGEELKDKNKITKSFGNIGVVYFKQVDYPKSLEYYTKALKGAVELGDKKLIAKFVANIGNVYKDQSNYSDALDNYFIALKMEEDLENQNYIVGLLCNIGSVYEQQAIANPSDKAGALSFTEKDRLHKKALIYYSKALKTAESLENKYLTGMLYANIGSLYTLTKKYREAEKYLLDAGKIFKEIGDKNDERLFEETLSELYTRTNRFELALEHYKKSMSIKDTLFSEENKKQLFSHEVNYEFGKKEAITKANHETQGLLAATESRRQKIIIWLVAGSLLSVLVFAGFVFYSLRVTRKQKLIIEEKNKLVEEKNKAITDRIHYAKRIQDVLLGEEECVSMHLPEHFILFLPKDIVSGDFYWGVEKDEYWYFAAVDCTGHGVPGAIMSMLGISFLNDIVSQELLCPSEILDRLRDKVMKELRQTGEEGGNKDGMDISLARLNLKTNELQWAGANNSLNIIKNGKLGIVKADKQPIGHHPNRRPFTNHEMQLQKGDSIYLYSDGFADQFGGAKGKKFKYKQLDELIITYKSLSMKEQKELLKKRFIEWKGSLEQVDDVCIFGVRV